MGFGDLAHVLFWESKEWSLVTWLMCCFGVSRMVFGDLAHVLFWGVKNGLWWLGSCAVSQESSLQCGQSGLWFCSISACIPHPYPSSFISLCYLLTSLCWLFHGAKTVDDLLAGFGCYLASKLNGKIFWADCGLLHFYLAVLGQVLSSALEWGWAGLTFIFCIIWQPAESMNACDFYIVTEKNRMMMIINLSNDFKQKQPQTKKVCC